MTKKPVFKAVLALITVSAIWGIASPVIVATLKQIPPFTFLYFRFFLATPFLLFIFLKNRKIIPEMSVKDFMVLAAMVFVGDVLTLGLIFVGFNYTTAIDGTLIGLLSPLMVVVGGALLLKEKITPREKVGLSLALFGSLVTIIQPILEQGASGKGGAFGNGLIFLSCISWAAYALWDKHTAKKHPPILIVMLGSALNLLVFAPLSLLEPVSATAFFDLRTVALGVIYMSILSYIAAYYLYEWAIRRIEVSEAAVFGYAQIIFAVPAAFIILGEIPTPYFLLGAALIGLGVFLTEYKPQKAPEGNSFPRSLLL